MREQISCCENVLRFVIYVLILKDSAGRASKVLGRELASKTDVERALEAMRSLRCKLLLVVYDRMPLSVALRNDLRHRHLAVLYHTVRPDPQKHKETCLVNVMCYLVHVNSLMNITCRCYVGYDAQVQV